MSRRRRNREQKRGCRVRLRLRADRSRCSKPLLASAGRRLSIARLVAARRGLLAGARFKLEPAAEGDRILLSKASAPGEQALGLRPQELRPAGTEPARGRAEAGATKQRRDRRRRHLDAELLQLAADPHVTPARILTPQAHHQRSRLPAERWSPWPALQARRSPANKL